MTMSLIVLDGSNLTFENGITVKIKREDETEAIPYSMKSIVERIEYNGGKYDILKRNDELVDSILNVCIDKCVKLAKIIDNHLISNPDIVVEKMCDLQKKPERMTF